MNQLHPRVTIVWRVTGLLAAAILTALAGLFEVAVLLPQGDALIYPGFLVGLVALVSIALAIFWPRLRYRYWRWLVEPDDELTLPAAVVVAPIPLTTKTYIAGQFTLKASGNNIVATHLAGH